MSLTDGEKEWQKLSTSCLCQIHYSQRSETREAILCHNRSNDAIAFLHHLIQDVLKDKSRFSCTRKELTCIIADWTVEMYSEVDAATAIVKNERMLIGKFRGYVTFVSSSHSVLRFTLTNPTTKSALWISRRHSMAGMSEFAVMSWPTFFEQRVEVINEVRDLGPGGGKRVLKAEAQAAARAGIFYQWI